MNHSEKLSGTKVYLLIGHAGEFDSYATKVLKVYSSKETCTKEVERIRKLLRDSNKRNFELCKKIAKKRINIGFLLRKNGKR